jgi:D-lactate dehydrogenase (cytochrome)
MWQARHDAYWACIALRPGAKAFATDVCVPISRLAECVTETQHDIAENKLVAPIVGHVGDGNFHVSVLLDMDDPAEVAACKAFNQRLVERALAMEGTCTGEHGVGQGKMKYLAAEHGEALAAMRAIKHALDPQELMNPGKIVAF